MSIARVTLTDSYQDIATGPCVITVQAAPADALDSILLIGQSDVTDATALEFRRDFVGRQIKQSASAVTRARGTAAGWVLKVDQT
jgi:hypothetical protein